MRAISALSPLNAAGVMAICCVLSAASQAQESYSRPTHKQTQVFRPSLEGKKLVLTSFCLDSENNFLVCSGGKSSPTGMVSALTSLLGSTKQPGRVTRFSPKFEHLASCDLKFVPTAIDVAPDGTIFVAGNGHVAKISDDLKVLLMVESPHIENPAEHKKKIREEVNAELEAQAKAVAQSRISLTEKIKELEAIPSGDRSAAQQAQLTAKKKTLESLSTPFVGLEGALLSTGILGDMLLESQMPSIAVSETDVFLVCSSGFRYEIWRFDHAFKAPEKVVANALGCCEQLDIQTAGNDLLLAENARFRVVRFDRDGKKITQFGSRDRSKPGGFGSCCNPMNIRCCPNGDILTAESSIGDIKQFTAAGEFKSFIGKAAIAGGCKRVTIEHDDDRDRYYMMHQDHGYICVLIPTSQAPEFTEEELAAKKAREGLGKTLEGKWKLIKAGRASLANGILGLEFPVPAGLQFHPDGRLKIEGDSVFARTNNNPESRQVDLTNLGSRWKAVRQEGKRLFIFQTEDRVEMCEYDIEFTSDNRFELRASSSGTKIFSGSYERAAQSEDGKAK